MRLSSKQREALQAVADGRVTYGDLYPQRTDRLVAGAEKRRAAGETVGGGVSGGREKRPYPVGRAAYAALDFQVDGSQVYGSEHSTYSSLSERDLIDAHPNEDMTARVVTLTDAGREALG